MMKFGWESADEKMLRYMKLPAKKKLDVLQKMHEFFVEAATPKRKKLFWKSRGIK